MRVQVNGIGDQVYYLLTDHLGSTAITVDTNNDKVAEIRYKPWGETRYVWGTTTTDYRFTGQREDSYINMYWIGSRWYDDQLGRWVQPDSVVPIASQGTQAWDRFAYSNNNSVKFADPSGHDVGCAGQDASGCISYNRPLHNPSADLKMDITISLAVDVKLTERGESADTDFAIVPKISGNGISGTESKSIPSGIAAANEIFRPFSDASNANATESDVYLNLYIDLYQVSADPESWEFQINAFDLKNESSSPIGVKVFNGVQGDYAFHHKINMIVEPNHSFRSPVNSNLPMWHREEPMKLWTFLKVYKDDPLGGVRIPGVDIYMDSKDYLFRLVASRGNTEITR